MIHLVLFQREGNIIKFKYNGCQRHVSKLRPSYMNARNKSNTCIVNCVITVIAEMLIADVTVGDELLDAVQRGADDLGRLALACELERQKECLHLNA